MAADLMKVLDKKDDILCFLAVGFPSPTEVPRQGFCIDLDFAPISSNPGFSHLRDTLFVVALFRLGAVESLRRHDLSMNFKVVWTRSISRATRPDRGTVQRFLPEIVEGDKRILIIDGKPVPSSLARIPQGSEIRGNLAAGAKASRKPCPTGAATTATLNRLKKRVPVATAFPSRKSASRS